MPELPQIVDLRQSPTALKVQRGVMRLLRATYDFCCFAEVPLANGRRADVLGVGPKGEIWIVEIKSLADRLPGRSRSGPTTRISATASISPSRRSSMPRSFPADEGLIVADLHGAAILREAAEHLLAPARRKAMMLKLVRLGADRVHYLMDPQTGGDAF